MQLSNILFSLVLATLGMAYEHGEIPSNIAVRSNGQGGVDFFFEEDRRAFEEAQLAKRQATNPETDIYPVSNDGSGVKPFLPEDMNTVAKAAIAGSAQEEKRQTGEVESDTYPVENDESGVKPFKGISAV